MITADFSVVCDGENCNAHFSDGYNRLLEQMHEAWIAARNAGWREVQGKRGTKQLCPKCHAAWLERKG